MTSKRVTIQAGRATKRPQLRSKLNQYISIPAFSLTYPRWVGASYVLGVATVTVGQNYQLRMPITAAATHVLVVRWNVGATYYRYKLWEGVGENVDYPLYAGEVIPSNAVYEIWCVEGQLTALNAAARNLLLDLLEDPTTCCDVEATGYDASVTDLYEDVS